MKKLLILSGKGGTGKTTMAAALIRFAKARAIADCDVDAPYAPLEDFCREKKLPVLLRIPYSGKFARLGAEGKILCEEDAEAAGMFRLLLAQIGGAAE